VGDEINLVLVDELLSDDPQGICDDLSIPTYNPDAPIQIVPYA
jgi:hypothetical protein